MKKKIRLYKSLDCIMAEFTVDGRPDDDMKSIMGTHIIPTAYTDRMEMVKAGYEIGKLNPGYIVEYFL